MNWDKGKRKTTGNQWEKQDDDDDDDDNVI